MLNGKSNVVKDGAMSKIIAVLSLVVFSLSAFGNETEKVITNKTLALVFRPGTNVVEIDYQQNGKNIKGAEIAPVITGKTLTGCRIDGQEEAGSQKTIRVNFATAKGEKYSLTLIMKENMPFVEVRAGEGVERVSVRMNSQYGIVPDFFANDLVFDPSTIKSSEIYPPHEHVFLNLIDQGNAILMCLWPSQKQSVKAIIANKRLSRMEIGCLKEKRVYVAILATPGIWHEEDTAKFDSLKDQALNWETPFTAKWCCDYPRSNGATDSFGIVRKEGKRYDGFSSIPNKVTRMAWTTSRSSFIYPCYSVGNRVFLRIPLFANYEDITYKEHGPILIYPFEKLDGSASLPIITPIDVIRVAFADTPEADLYKKIRVELSSKSRYPPTCGITEKAEKRFDNQKEKQEKAQMIKELAAMNKFVEVTRERIEEYQTWAKGMQEFYNAQKKIHPELMEMISDFEKRNQQIIQRYARVKSEMKMPSDARVLSDQIVVLIDSSKPDKAETVKQIGRKIRTIGGCQDGLVGASREMTAAIRQNAGILMAESQNEIQRAFLQEVRDRAAAVLKVNHGIETGIEQSRW